MHSISDEKLILAWFISPASWLRAASWALLILVLAACSASSGPADAVEAYLNALVSQDEARLSTLSCADWETSARSELASFTAVTVQLTELNCQENGQADNMTLVSCTGKIIANYGNEVLEIDLADRTYQAVSEGGDWRMCGYR